jgi:release factor H-coupled RctB family protein
MEPAAINRLYSSKTWVSPDVEPQLRNAAALPGMLYMAAMPDLHPGAGSPGGVAFVSSGLIHPKLIGGDIGCGMHLCVTNLDAKTKFSRVADKLGSIDDRYDGNLGQLMATYHLESTGYESKLGTIGGGNHFMEFQVVHEIRDPATAAELGILQQKALLLVHSGSRSFGQAVLNDYNEQSRGIPLDPNSQEGIEYLEDHDQAVRFAKANRVLIAARVAENLGIETKSTLDLSHNSMERRKMDGQEVWIHRKGAAPADQGLVVIPGSRDSYTYIVRPLGDGRVNAFSLAHGAGRKISRTKCEEKFKEIAEERLRRPKDKDLKIDNIVICEDRDLLRQEHGKAYKDIDRVIEDMHQLGLLEVVAVLKPVLTYKTRSATDDGDG